MFLGHALMENFHGLLVDFQVTPADGTAEQAMVPELVDAPWERGVRPRTLGADKSYDTAECGADLYVRDATPRVAQNTGRKGSSGIDGRNTRHVGYGISQRIRKRVEEIFGWMKTGGGFRRTRFRGLDLTGLAGYLVATAYNPVRLSRLATHAAPLPAA